jgi:hypothetical protein
MAIASQTENVTDVLGNTNLLAIVTKIPSPFDQRHRDGIGISPTATSNAVRGMRIRQERVVIQPSVRGGLPAATAE